MRGFFGVEGFWTSVDLQQEEKVGSTRERCPSNCQRVVVHKTQLLCCGVFCTLQTTLRTLRTHFSTGDQKSHRQTSQHVSHHLDIDMLNFLSKGVAGIASAPVVAASAAILGSILAERLAAQPLEIWSDIVCWVVLLAAFKYTSRASSRHSNHDRLLGSESSRHGGWRRSFALWLVTICLVPVCIFKSELGMVVLLVSCVAEKGWQYRTKPRRN